MNAEQESTHVEDQGTYVAGNQMHQQGSFGVGVNQGSINIITGEVGEEMQAPAPEKRSKTQIQLLDRVKHEVYSRLHSSLHNYISINIDKEEHPSQVHPPWAIDVKVGTRHQERLPQEKTIVDVYDRKDVKGSLLILGEPGSGKTTTLLLLARSLIRHAYDDSNQPIAIINQL